MADKQNKNKVSMDERLSNSTARLANTYSWFEETIMRIVRWLFSVIDRYIFNVKHNKLVAFLIAVVLFISVNYDSTMSLFGSPMLNSRVLEGVTINAQYNYDAFEVTGLPKSVDVIISGDSSDLVSATNSSGYIVANLEGMTEGTHTVRFEAEGFPESVRVTIDPSEAVITMKPKATMSFEVGYDFVNVSRMSNIYSLGTPTFESSTINVRASQDTLDSIAFVKALIDVSGVTADFETEARLVAYDANGKPVDCEIVPETIRATVPVASPSKTVAISVQLNGTLPDGLAIQDIALDNNTVTVYGSESVLDSIDNVVVTVDASTLTTDTRLSRPLVLPNGVNSSSINQVNMDITLGEATTRVLEGIPLSYRNNTNGYNISSEGYQANIAVTISGTQENVDAVTADQINAYIDFTDVQPGVNEMPIHLETPDNPYVTFTTDQTSITVNVLDPNATQSETVETEG